MIALSEGIIKGFVYLFFVKSFFRSICFLKRFERAFFCINITHCKKEIVKILG